MSFIKIDTAGEMAKQPSAHVISAFTTRSVAEFASSIKIAGEPYLWDGTHALTVEVVALWQAWDRQSLMVLARSAGWTGEHMLSKAWTEDRHAQRSGKIESANYAYAPQPIDTEAKFIHND